MNVYVYEVFGLNMYNFTYSVNRSNYMNTIEV